MNKKAWLLPTIALAVLLSSAIGHHAASEPTGPTTFKTRDLIMLEQMKAELEAEGKEFPEELLRKIEWETAYTTFLAQEMKKSELEIRQIEEMRAKAPKDAKGNPILPEPEFPEVQPEPYKEAGQVGDREYAESFFPRSFTSKNELVSAITAPYDVLVSGIDRDDANRSFIIRINNAASRGEPGREQFDFEGIGAIRFVKLIDDRMAIFHYDGGREGFFDLAENKAEFRPYDFNE
jgi:hypothetical protein